MIQAARIQKSSPFRKRSGAGRRGATIVEFALVFVLFFVVLLAIMEVGRGMWVYATIATATRRAGDYCMVLRQSAARRCGGDRRCRRETHQRAGPIGIDRDDHLL